MFRSRPIPVDGAVGYELNATDPGQINHWAPDVIIYDVTTSTPISIIDLPFTIRARFARENNLVYGAQTRFSLRTLGRHLDHDVLALKHHVSAPLRTF